MGDATYEQGTSLIWTRNDADKSVPYLFYYEQMLAVTLMD